MWTWVPWRIVARQLAVEQQVAGLEVAVDHARAVHRRQAAGGLQHQAQGLGGGEAAAGRNGKPQVQFVAEMVAE